MLKDRNLPFRSLTMAKSGLGVKLRAKLELVRRYPLVRVPDPDRHSALHGSEEAVRSPPERLAGKTADDKGKEGQTVNIGKW